MSQESREVVLADFQACTGIDDLGEALEHLEQSDWNLVTAINRVLPQDTQILPSERVETLPLPTMSERENLNRGNNISENGQVPGTNSIPQQNVATARQGSNTVNTKQNDLDGSDSSGSTSDIEDLDLTESFADDDYFAPEPSHVRRQQQRYLIADNIADEATGAAQFAESFAVRYGNNRPNFVIGGLDVAVREATLRPARDRKLLAIYLHHDESVHANIFCQQVLCSEGVGNLLRSNFVVWGWDVTHESNRQTFLTAATRSIGTSGVTTIRSLDRERYPVILLISRNRATVEMTSVIPGAIGVDEMVTMLLSAIEVFNAQQSQDIRDEVEREARESVIREQNEAYEESLRADIAKDNAKKAVEAEKKREENEKMAESTRLEAERKKTLDSLVPEPSKESQEPLCSLRCRFPNGKVVSRRFLQSSTLQDLFDFLFTEGYSIEMYKVLFSYPKKDLTELYEENQAIGSVFAAQDTLILEER